MNQKLLEHRRIIVAEILFQHLSVKKRYDQALTPYQRVLQSKSVSKAKKEQLRANYATLNPVALKRKIERLQQRLDKTTSQTNWRECARMVAVTAAQRTNPF